nr:GNAT family N-acetyltransferase [Jiella mangrovi]
MKVARPSSGTNPVPCIHIALGEDRDWYLSLLAVAPDQQGKGVGGALLEDVARQASESGIRHLRITAIRQSRDLIAWYEARGFRSTGETVCFPYDDPSVGRPLRNDLELIALERLLPSRSAASDRRAIFAKKRIHDGPPDDREGRTLMGIGEA